MGDCVPIGQSLQSCVARRVTHVWTATCISFWFSQSSVTAHLYTWWSLCALSGVCVCVCVCVWCLCVYVCWLSDDNLYYFTADALYFFCDAQLWEVCFPTSSYYVLLEEEIKEEMKGGVSHEVETILLIDYTKHTHTCLNLKLWPAVMQKKAGSEVKQR